MAEFDGAGNLVSRFVYATHGNVPDYMLREGVTYRLVKDHLGSVRLVVNTTNGEVAQRLDYDSFGQVQLDTKPGFQPFGYAGGLYDPATSLVRFGVRDYDPQAGRWTTPDPIGYAAGDTNLYAYAYAYNSPTNLRDPSGAVVPLIVGGVIVYNLLEAGMTVADLVDVYDTFTDPWADFWDKGLSAAGAAAGMGLPGGGWGRGANKLKEVAEGACDGRKSLYRAVGPDELNDIRDSGRFRNPPGIENKYFTDSAENAKAYGDKAQQTFGDGPYTVVETSIPNSALSPAMDAARVSDIPGGLPTTVVPSEALPSLAPPVIHP